MDAEVAGPRFPTPTGGPCPRSVRVDGTVEGSGACVGCGTCLQFGGLVEGLDEVGSIGDDFSPGTESNP